MLLNGRVCWLKHLFVVLCFFGTLVLPAVAKAGPTVVSLTFDDGTADEYQVRPMLAQYGLHATFFINSNNIGASSAFMTWDQLSGLSADGNEITGHTLDHVDLTTVSTTEATRQVCDDRQALISHGFNPTDFAYPYGSSNSTVESIVRGCGYSSGRRAWGLCPIGQAPPNCPDGIGGQYSFTTTVPPPNIWGIRVTSIRATHTLADIEATVTNAESAGGGWVPILMHHVCDGCDPTNGGSVSPAILSAFLDWLAPRAATGTCIQDDARRGERQDASYVVDCVQRCRLRRLVPRYRQRVPVGHRRGHGRLCNPLHDQRDRPDHLQSALHRPPQRLGDDYGQVPRLGHGRKRRGDQEPADPGRRERSQLVDRLWRRHVLERLVHVRRQRVALVD